MVPTYGVPIASSALCYDRQSTENTEKKYLIIFLNFVIPACRMAGRSVISACPVKCEAYLTGVRYNLSLSDNKSSNQFSRQLPGLNIFPAWTGFNLHHSPTVNREPLNREPVYLRILAGPKRQDEYASL
jgi:hypothetical protein